MEPSLALHTAARRYLIDRRAEWLAAYGLLPNEGRAADDYHYADKAKDIYPRYNVLDAIRVEVERLDADHLPELDAVAGTLRRAAHEAQSLFTTGRQGRIERAAMADERSRFIRWVDHAATDAPPRPEPLPFHRTLTPEESAQWWARVEERWSVEDGTWWGPITTPDQRPGTLLLNQDAFWDDGKDGPATLAVRRALTALGLRRVIELREYGPEYEVDVDALSPTYTGAEGIFTAESLDWLVFASHEGVTAIGGILVDGLKAAWPEWELATWSGSEWVGARLRPGGGPTRARTRRRRRRS